MSDLLAAGGGMRSFCTFRIQGRLHGIEVAQVREVSPMLPVTPVPQAPPPVRGLVNLRSRIYLALDVRPLLGLPPVEATPQSRLIILKPQVAADVGVQVEEGGDIVHVAASQIESAASIDAPAVGASSLVNDVCKLEGELLMVVDPKRLIEAVTNLK
jgi:purine-binding chemotaxis protein CheW